MVVSLVFQLDVVLRFQVSLEAVSLAECLNAFGTVERLLFGVSSNVEFESLRLRELSTAVLAFVWPFSGVDVHVLLEASCERNGNENFRFWESDDHRDSQI